ncbi:ARM repeat-containing protein [Xylaria intraflava]|nr:ARM repeat-containing protein [Xylaria intraflava]
MAGSNNSNPQHLNTFSASAWDQNTAIWGGVGTFTYNRNTTASAGSDELSPTAPSGPSQSNLRSGSVPWGSGLLNPARPNPNSVSPTRNGSNILYHLHENGNSVTPFPVRQSLSQGRPSLQNRTVPPGPVDNAGFATQYRTAVGGMVGEERGSSRLYLTSGASSHLSSDNSRIHRRNSADPSYLGVGQSRPGAFAGRQSETIASSLASPYGETAPYPFFNGGHPRPQNQRPSISGVSPTLPPETTRGQGLQYPHTPIDISESLGRRLTLDDTAESSNGYVSNRHTNLAKSFQSNSNSQTWQEEISNGVRSFSHGTQQDAWAEASQTYYSSARRASVERSSPVGSLYRQQISPRNMSGTPNSRIDPWNRSVPRNPTTMSHDLDRQQQGTQYPQQPAAHFGPYSNPSLHQFPTTYEQYSHPIQNYSTQVPVTGYTMHLNYTEVPVRTGRSRDPAQGARSKLLEEFRNRHKTGRHFELKDIYKHVVEFSGDQHGSRFIQDKLEVANSEEKEHLFEEILPNAIQLMKDVFGNYVIQKFFDYGSQVQKKLLAAKMEKQIAELSVQMYSCRVVQKALEHVLVEQQEKIVEELSSKILSVAMDQNGNHVVQKIIHMFPRRCIPFTMEAFRGQIETLAMHGYVCRVIQRILEHCTPAERRSLMADIHPCAAKLMTDQYGNYVIQHVIEHGQPEDRQIMIQQVISRAVALSKHKYASNIVEKCVQFGEVEDKRAILNRLTTPSSDRENPLPAMMKDQYANYVIQRLIEHLDGDEKTTFATEVQSHLPLLKKQCSGRQNTAIERLTTATNDAHARVISTANTRNAATGGSAPSSPNLAAAEVSSSSPTPFLTTEQNSPQSSSPPSTNLSTAGDAGEDTKTSHSPRLTKESPNLPTVEN